MAAASSNVIAVILAIFPQCWWRANIWAITAGTNHKRERAEYMLYIFIFHGLLQTLCDGRMPASLKNIKKRQKCFVDFSCFRLFTGHLNIPNFISVDVLWSQCVILLNCIMMQNTRPKSKPYVVATNSVWFLLFPVSSLCFSRSVWEGYSF